MADAPSSAVTISDIARAAGVSTATVSRVLNQVPGVAEETRLHVQRVIEETGYRSNRARRARSSARYITVIARSVDNEYIGAIFSGILDQLDMDSYQAVLHLRGTDLSREIDYVRVAQRRGTDGLLIIIPRIRGSALSELMHDTTPYVLIDSYPNSPTAPCVRASNWQGGRQASKYLVSLGHRRIAFVGGFRGHQITEEREHGYRSVLVEAGIPYDADLVVDGEFTQASGYQAGSKLLALEERPTAIFACSDLMAFGVMEAAYMAGLRVPADLSVVGFDDIASSATRHPPLTSVRQPLYEMGRMAAQMVVALATEQEVVSRQIELPTQLIVRSSCSEPHLGQP